MSSSIDQFAVLEAHRNSYLDHHMLSQHNDLILGDDACRVNPAIPVFLFQFPRFVDSVLVAQDHREYVEVSLLSPLSHLIIRYLGSCIPDSD